MITWLIILALIWPLLWVIRWLFTARLVMGLEFRAMKVVPLGTEEVSPHLREAAQPWIAQLEAVGFQPLGGWHVTRTDDGALDEFAVVLTHGEQPVRAIIRPHDLAARSGECWVSLRTTTADGSEIVTNPCAPEELVPRPTGIEVEVLAGAGVPELWPHHLSRIDGVAAEAWRCVDLQGAVQREQYVCDGVFAYLQASGLVVERDPGVFSFRPVAALKRAAYALRHAAKQKKLDQRKVAQTPPPSGLSVEAQMAFDWQHYRQIGAVMRGRMSTRVKAAISVVSFLVFAAVLGWTLSPVVAVSLIVALVVHEGGHLLGMKWFGFRDTQLLFIPFFGGAAVGHDDKVLRPWQHIVIILLGPMPGLFAGLAMLAYNRGGNAPEWWNQAALTAAVLNAFNLLPILPLDGGQIVDYAVASRFPRARVLFLAVSALGLLGVALLLDGVKLLLGLAILMLLRVPFEWRLARVRHEMRREFPAGGEEEPIVRRLLARLRAPEWAKVPMIQRLQVARALQNVLRTPRPGFGTLCFAIAGYTAPLWGGIPLAIWAAHREGEALVQAAEQNVRAAGLALHQNGAGRMPATLPEPTSVVPDEDNAALPYAKAKALFETTAPPENSDARQAEIIALLRMAARKRAFAPDNLSAAETKLTSWAARSGRGLLVRHLTSAAEERLRYREPATAAAMLLDALRLIRLMDAAPGWWTWQMHQQFTTTCWTAFEEVLASGAPLSPNVLAELDPLIDERHEIAFASAVLPHDLLEEARGMDELMGGTEIGVGLRLLVVLQSIGTGAAQTRADTMNRAVALHGYLQAIQQGRWPELVANAKEMDRALVAIAQLADVLARLRQARAAVLVMQRRLRGEATPSLQALKLPGDHLLHPFTRETMRWTRRGSIDVLMFANGIDKLSGRAGAGRGDLVWRLPVENTGERGGP